MKGTYYRWTEIGEALMADILGADTEVISNPVTGMVTVEVPRRPLNPDEARMIGVRLIEAAAYAGRDQAVKGSEMRVLTPIKRQWIEGDDEPTADVVSAITDRTGYRWSRVDGGWIHAAAARLHNRGEGPKNVRPWSYVTSHYGPVTEADNAN